ncbi:hypothetical protein [Vibrio parahaemolyticus]|uniref:hypothetical protein n=1 Tax=Vibrio parahaemolyticus TaxID=670 RepID=UPI0015DD6FD8|nr:hypothetical protein [Vibrio parahaemolyticus]
MENNSELAICILSENKKVRYGMFGYINGEKYFPPLEFFNDFLKGGNDPCDQDGLMGKWTPFTLSEEEYQVVLEWWRLENPDFVVDTLDASDWNDWCLTLIEMEDT